MRREQMERWLASDGMTVEKWCRLNRMSTSTFYLWLNKFTHTPLVFDHLVVFLSRKRQNRRFGAGGTCKRGRRGHQSKQLPTKHQVAEGARGQKQERDHPDLPQTVDFVVLDVIF